VSRLGLDAEEIAESRQRRRGRIAVLIATLLMVGIIAGGAWAFMRLLDSLGGSGPEDYAGPGKGQIVVEVKTGDSATKIGDTLEEADVVASRAAFVAAARADDRSASVQPGFYALQKQMKAADALDLMLDPSSRVQARVTVPEGLRLDRTIALLASKTGIPVADFQAALKQPGALGLPPYAKGHAEGYLFPATYDVRPDAKALDVLKMMTKRFGQASDTVGLESGTSVKPAQLVTIASLVEAEARRPEDFGKVARVIYNRLAAGMPLQLDSTVNYALRANKEIVTNADLGVDSPYNTYKNKGLPPGPIGSPGEAGLKAAKSPTAGDWLYFVTVNPKTGETKFTADYNEFLEFKDELKRNQKS
jgi:UPF0755 protein